MSPNGEGWHYFAVKKKLPSLLRGITSKHHSDFYCLNCLHSFATENKRESHRKVYENKDFCNVVMPSEDTKIFNQYQKSDKIPFIIYADFECLIEKIDGCKNNPENSYTIKVSEHIPSGFSMSTISRFMHRKYAWCIQSCIKMYTWCIKRFVNIKGSTQWRYLILKRKKWSY